MRLFAITPAKDIINEQQYLEELIAEGFIVHCRKPEKNAVEMAAFLREIKPEYRPSVAIHSHFEIAEDMGIRRLHFTEELREKLNPDDFKYGKNTLSTSVHSFEQLENDEKLKFFEYIFCSPVFDSISKPENTENKIWQQKVSKEYQFDLIALGGLTAENLPLIYHWGYSGAAFCGYLWNDESQVRESFTKIKEVWLKDLML
ncbi:MAG: thiamine phosphate synthase [Candidatus Cyclobacteriaceae bacterium M2_1C_046]